MKTKMKKSMIAIAFFAIILLSSCSEDSNSPAKTNFQIVSGISNTELSNNSKIASISTLLPSSIDSMHIKRVRVLISRIKLNIANDDKNAFIGPLVYEVTDSTKSISLGQVLVPNGNLNKIKYEFHRFESSVLNNYKNSPVFKDFATNDRYTVIIEGTTFSNNTSKPFTYNSDVVANATIDLANNYQITDDSFLKFMLEFQSDYVFIQDGVLVDPSDTSMRTKIDNRIKNALKAIKK